jgi:hypothetical protein
MLNRNIVRKIVNEAGTKIFTVTFRKKDGSIREMNNCLLRESPATHKNHLNLFTIEDIKSKQVRTADYARILRIASQGMVIESKELKKVN